MGMARRGRVKFVQRFFLLWSIYPYLFQELHQGMKTHMSIYLSFFLLLFFTSANLCGYIFHCLCDFSPRWCWLWSQIFSANKKLVYFINGISDHNNGDMDGTKTTMDIGNCTKFILSFLHFFLFLIYIHSASLLYMGHL